MIDNEIRAHAHGTCHIDAKCVPVYHCPHDGGEMSIRLTGSLYGNLDVYVTGTRKEIAEWALKVRDEAIRGEEGE
jgi:hypothetical protein